MSRRFFIIIILLVVIVFITSALITLRTLAKHVRDSIPVAVSNPARYGEFLAAWKPSGLVGHFPASVPGEATNIHFSESPGFGQGMGWIQVQFQLPADEVAAIEADVHGKTNHVYAPDHAFYLPAAKGDWPTPNYHATNIPSQFQFPATFKIYIINAVDRGSGSWDPYDSYGIAISRETNEVVYWAQQ